MTCCTNETIEWRKVLPFGECPPGLYETFNQVAIGPCSHRLSGLAAGANEFLIAHCGRRMTGKGRTMPLDSCPVERPPSRPIAQKLPFRFQPAASFAADTSQYRASRKRTPMRVGCFRRPRGISASFGSPLCLYAASPLASTIVAMSDLIGAGTFKSRRFNPNSSRS
jgi:hypothetical protein